MRLTRRVLMGRDRRLAEYCSNPVQYAIIEDGGAAARWEKMKCVTSTIIIDAMVDMITKGEEHEM